VTAAAKKSPLVLWPGARAERAASRALLSEGYDWRAALRNVKVWEEGEQQIVVAEKIGGFVSPEKAKAAAVAAPAAARRNVLAPLEANPRVSWSESV
jgi:hypothetical protein